MWKSKQFLCEMVNDIFIYDPSIMARMESIEHEYGENSLLSKAFLDITNKCNIKCKHCFTNARADSHLDELTTEQIKCFINELQELKISRLALGGGEPLVRPDIYEIIQYASSKGIRIHMSTNGKLLTEDNIIRLKDAGLDSVQISIDSMNAEVHDELRACKGLFAQCMNAVRLVQKHGISLIVSTTITKLNVNELQNIIEVVKNAGVKMHRFIRFVPVGRGEEFKKSLYVEPEVLAPIMIKLHEEYDEYLFGDKRYIYGMPVLKYQCDEFQSYESPVGCEAGKLCVDVLSNGNVVPCNYLGTDEKWVCGNIKNESFVDIVRDSKVINEFRKLNGSNIEGCGSCRLKDKCGKGCRALAFNLYGNEMYRDPCCTQ